MDYYRNTRLFIAPILCAFAFTACKARQDGPKPQQEAALQEPEENPQSVLRAELEKEFKNAYPKSAPPPVGRRVFEMHAAPTQVQHFDGAVLNVWAYNDQVPGPVLRVRLGEEVVVNFKNDLPQPTTIHWHGMRVPNAMDGVPGVTQKAIEPGGTFVYRFVPKDAGTFWFHPHVRTAEQVERGLYGVIIVEDKVPLPYSRDEVWVLDDWKLGPDGEVDPRFVTRHDLAHDGRWGRKITVNGDSDARLIVRPGERIRLRLANTANGRSFRPDFGNLAVKVIAVDGMYTASPRSLAEFEMAPGNRLDLDIVIPKDAAGKSFKVIDTFTRNRFQLARIDVNGEPIATPNFAPPRNLNIPKWTRALEREVDVTYVLNARRGGKYGIQWTINGQAWGSHQITELVGDRFVRIRFQNDSSRLHPMHIHGQFFKVIAKNGSPVDMPYFKDTVLLHRKETIDVAMVPIDWGKWMMHCHILEHAAAGMMTEIHVK